MENPLKLVLASQSPRRKELLALTGIPFCTLSPDIDETFDPGLSADQNVISISRRKAVASVTMLDMPPGEAVILAADTTVVLDGQPLGKPGNAGHAIEMLTRIQGRTHEVLTGYAILHKAYAATGFSRTIVRVAPISQEEIEQYVATMKPYDKAGSYGIQDPLFACYVEGIEGCYYNVVGLPVADICRELKTFFPRRSFEP